MAVNFKIDKDHLKRGSMYLIDPRLVKINPELNGRHDLPPIDDLVQGFQDSGQIQPCPIGNDGGDAVLRMGHRRWRASIFLTENHPLPDLGYWPLKCVYYEGTEWEAYLAAIGENHHRESTTPIDDAHNCARMQRHGMSVESIAKVFYPAAKSDEEKLKTACAWVRQRLALLTLSEEGAEAVKEGRLKPSAAVAIAKLSQKAQKEIFDNNRDSKRITAAVAIPSDKPKMRPMKEVLAFWKPYTETPQETKISKFARIQTAYAMGGDPDEYFRAVRELLGDK